MWLHHCGENPRLKSSAGDIRCKLICAQSIPWFLGCSRNTPFGSRFLSSRPCYHIKDSESSQLRSRMAEKSKRKSMLSTHQAGAMSAALAASMGRGQTQ